MVKVTTPNRVVTYTSGESFDSTFHVDVQGEISDYEYLEFRAKSKDFDDLNDVISINIMSSYSELPEKMYLPDDTSRVQPSFEVHREFNHPDMIVELTVRIEVYGDGEVYLADDEVQLEG